MYRPPRLECKNPRRNAAGYHAKRLVFSRDWIVKMLFSEAATEYMADKRKRLRATTLEGYESALRCHVLPAWGQRYLRHHLEVDGHADGRHIPVALRATAHRDIERVLGPRLRTPEDTP